jgi:hypothetical protein
MLKLMQEKNQLVKLLQMLKRKNLSNKKSHSSNLQMEDTRILCRKFRMKIGLKNSVKKIKKKINFL